MSMNEIAVIVVGLLGSGALGGILTTLLTNRRTMNQDLFEQLSKRLERVEEAEAQCVKKNIELSLEVGRLREAVLRMEATQIVKIVAVITTDEEGKVLTWSTGASVMFRYVESEVVGKNVDILIPSYLKERHHQAMDAAVMRENNDLNVRIRDVMAIDKDGRNVPVHIEIDAYTNSVTGRKNFEARVTRVPK